MLEPFEVLGVADRAPVEPLLVAGAAGLDLLHVRVGLALLPGQVVDLHLEVPGASVDLCALGGELAQLGRLGRVLGLVPEGVEAAVELLDVEQLELGEGVGFQGVLLEETGQTRNVQGSVTSVLTRVSTVSPRAVAASRTFRSTTGSQLHSAAQCATSTSAGPPSSRNSPARWCFRSEVT